MKISVAKLYQLNVWAADNFELAGMHILSRKQSTSYFF